MQIPNTLPLFIAGKEITSQQTFSNLNPFGNKEICQVTETEPDHIENAIRAAKQAQKEWAKRSPKERATVLRDTAKILREQNDSLAKIESMDTGRAIRETLVVDIISGADCLEYIASFIEVHRSSHIPLDENSFAYTLDLPLGICLGIGAWNYPLQIACWKSAPALAMGNAFIFKPSEHTPVSAYFLAKAYQEAGLPDGLFQVLQGDGSVGKQLVEHPDIAKVSLTGSVPTGQKIYQSASAELKKVSLELGGKSPFIVFDDASMEAAVQSALLANFYSQGQICSNGTRVFLHSKIKDQFIEKLEIQTKRIIVGDPLDPKTHLGPLINSQHKANVTKTVETALSQGAEKVCGGPLEGNLFAPTILRNCHDQMDCVREEIFGPVMSILEFNEESEVIERANHTEFGLAGGVFTENLGRAHRVARQLKAGVCWINSYNLTPVEMPFGGAKMSGLGSENGHEVLKEYSRSQSIYVDCQKDYDSFFE
jgi:betaine-aldehyde dehydrogenase